MSGPITASGPTADVPAWTDHVIVCGLHGDGVRVVEQLQLTGTLGEAGLAGAAALVCVESDDLHTLATALLARELAPQLRIVVGLGNAAVGRALESIEVAVLDIAGLSSPWVIEACLDAQLHPLQLGGQEFLVVRAACGTDGTLRQLFGDLAPVGVLPPDGGLVDHPRSRPPRPSRRRRGAGRSGESGPRCRSGLGRPCDAAELRRRPDRRLTIVLFALAGLITLSVIVLTHGYREADGTRMSVLDALYFTVETIGTVGYGDFYFRDQSSWLRVWAIGLMLVGATMATVFFALLTNMLITRTIAALGRRRVTGLSDHVIVVGLGTIGLGVVDGLRAAGVDVLVVETDEENRFLAAVGQHDVPVVIADATLPDTFAMVRLERARAVAVLTSDDLVTIETGLAIRDLLAERWAAVPVVLRLFDRRLASTVEASFDFRFVRSTSAWPRRGSSAPRSGWTCWERSISATGRCWSAVCGSPPARC